MTRSRSTRWLLAMALFVAASIGFSTAFRPTVALGQSKRWDYRRADGGVVVGPGDGRPSVHNFWATWCPPCIEELPQLEAASGRLRDAGLALYLVNRDQAMTPGEVLAWMHARHPGLEADVVFEAHPEVDPFGVEALPTTYLLDADGGTRWGTVGALEAASLEALVGGGVPARRAP